VIYQLNVFIRLCHTSDVSINKSRPSWFDRENILRKMLNNFCRQKWPFDTIYIVYDSNRGEMKPYMKNIIEEFKDKIYKVIEINGGTEAKAFQLLLREIINETSNLEKSEKDETMIYIVEDDYVHMPNALDYIRDGLKISAYVSLYDHPDKYTILYQNLRSQLVLGGKSVWRTTPSTTNTFACTLKTLREDLDVHMKYSDGHILCTRDHEKFIELGKKGRPIITPIPSRATHVENGVMAFSEEPWELV
jgi:hypothetical protein